MELRTDQGSCSFICKVSFLGTCHRFSQRDFRFHNVPFPTCPTPTENSKWTCKVLSLCSAFFPYLGGKQMKYVFLYLIFFFIGIAESGHRDNFLGWQLLYTRLSPNPPKMVKDLSITLKKIKNVSRHYFPLSFLFTCWIMWVLWTEYEGGRHGKKQKWLEKEGKHPFSHSLFFCSVDCHNTQKQAHRHTPPPHSLGEMYFMFNFPAARLTACKQEPGPFYSVSQQWVAHWTWSINLR